MKRSITLGCLLLAVLLLLPLAATRPVTAAGFKKSIIDVTEGDPVWGRPILVMGENVSDEEADDLFRMLNIDSEEQIILLESTHRDVDRYVEKDVGEYASCFRVSSLLIQHQAPGSGLEIQFLNPDWISGTKSVGLVTMIADMCGFTDAKIVIATPRRGMNIGPALSGLYLAAQYDAPPFRHRISTIGRYQGKHLNQLQLNINSLSNIDAYDAVLDDLLETLMQDRDNGVLHTPKELAAMITERFQKAFPERETEADHVADLAAIYELWQRTPVGDAARIISNIDVSEGDALWDKPVLINGGEMKEEELAVLMEILGIPNPEAVDILVADRSDTRDLIMPDVGSGSFTGGVAVLIQNQPAGYGLDLRVFSPDLIENSTEQIFRMVALTEGIRDAKIEILTNLRKYDPGHVPMAGIVKAYLEHGHEVDKNLREFVQEEFSVLYDLMFYAGNDAAPDGRHFSREQLNDALEVIFDELLEEKAMGNVLDEPAVRELFERNLEAYGQLQFLKPEDLTAVIDHFVDWSESDVALDVGPLHPGGKPGATRGQDLPIHIGEQTLINLDDEDARWDKSTLVVGEDVSETTLQQTFRQLGIQSAEQVEIVQVSQTAIETEEAAVLVQTLEQGSGVHVQVVSSETYSENRYLYTSEQYRQAAITMGVEDANIVVLTTEENSFEAGLVGITRAFDYHEETLIQERLTLAEEELKTYSQIISEVYQEESFSYEAFDQSLEMIKSSLLEVYHSEREISECRTFVTVEDSLYEHHLLSSFTRTQISTLSSYFFEWISNTWIQEDALRIADINVSDEDYRKMVSIIDVAQPDELWDKAIFVYGEDCTEEEIGAMLQKLGVSDPDQVERLAISEDDVKQYVLLMHDAYAHQVSSVLIQNQPQGSGVEVQILTPDTVTDVGEEHYRSAAETAGIKDAKIIVLSPREATGEAALAGVYYAYEKYGDHFDAERLTLAQEELTLLSTLSQKLDDPNALDTAIGGLKEQLRTRKDAGDSTNGAVVSDLLDIWLDKAGIAEALSDADLNQLKDFYTRWIDEVDLP